MLLQQCGQQTDKGPHTTTLDRIRLRLPTNVYSHIQMCVVAWIGRCWPCVEVKLTETDDIEFCNWNSRSRAAVSIQL